MDCEEVRDRLEGVVVVCEGVDDGDRGVLCEIDNFTVLAGADHHAGGHGGDHDGCVVDRFIDLKPCH